MPSIGLGLGLASGVGIEGAPVASPAVTAITPSSGLTSGGTSITNLAGTGFVSGCTVKIGGQPATSVIFVSSTKLTCVTPAGTGVANVVVTNPDAKDSGASGSGLYTFVLAPPVVTGITPNTGAIAGGDAITNLAGTGFQSGATVTIGGTPATSVTFVSSTKLTCVTPAGISGAQDVVVTNPDAQTSGSSGVGLFTYASPFTPASLSPDGWFRDYAGAPWTPTTPSANGNLIAVTSVPTPAVGTAVNGHTPAHFDGSTTVLQSASASSSFVNATAMTIVTLFKAIAPLSVDQAAWYSEFPLVGGNAGDFGYANSASGVRGGNGGAGNTPYVALAAGVWAMAVLRVSGTTVKIRVSQPGGTVDSAPATIAGVSLDSFLKLGVNWSNAIFQHADILEVLTWKSTLADADLVNILGYFNARYALGLT